MATYFRKDGWVKSAVGPAVPGAQVFVCAQPANVPSSLTATAPTPTPLANIFSDVNGLVPITQPIITDGFGHYDYYTEAGTYTECIYLSSVLQQFYPDQSIGGVGSSNPPGNDTGLVAGTNITIVGQTISATVPGGIELQTNGVDNDDQTLLNLSNSDGTIVLEDLGDGDVDIRSGVNPSTAYTILGNVRGWLANWDAAALAGVGVTLSGGVGTLSRVDPTATEGAAVQSLSQAIPAGQGSFYSNNVLGITRGALQYWQARCRIGATTPGVLYYAGLTDVNPGSTLMLSSPTTQNVCAFRYETGDANWSLCASDAGGIVTELDSGVPVDTNFHLFRMLFSTGQVQFYIDDDLVGTMTTPTHHLPAVGTQLGSMITIQANAVANVVQFVWYSF